MATTKKKNSILIHSVFSNSLLRHSYAQQLFHFTVVSIENPRLLLYQSSLKCQEKHLLLYDLIKQIIHVACDEY